MPRWLDSLKAFVGRSTKSGPPMGAVALWGNFGNQWGFPSGVVGVNFTRLAGDFSRNGTIAIGLHWLEVNALSGPKLCVGVMNRESGKYGENPDHPLTTDLKRPNPFWPASSLIGNTVRNLAYPGYAYWIKGTGPLGQPEYYWVPTNTMMPVPAPMGSPFPIARYDYTPPGGGQVFSYQPSQVVHFRLSYDPDCFWQGLSPLAAQIRSVAALNAGETWQAGVLRNGHRATLLSPKDGRGMMEQAEIDGLRDRLARGSSGDAAGSIVGVTEAIDTNALGFSPEEMLVDRILDRPEGMVVAALGLNSLVLNLPSSHDTRTYANFGEAKVQAAEYGLKPILAVIAETVQSQVLPDYEVAEPTSEVWWDYSEYGPLQEDADARANRAQVLFDGGIAKLNEARELAGLASLDASDPRGDQFKSEIGMAQALEIHNATGMNETDGKPNLSTPPPGPRGALSPPDNQSEADHAAA